MMTTGLNHGRPYRLPFRDPDRLFYFSGDEFSRLFPPLVVQHMIDRAPESKGIPPQATGSGRLYAFPNPRDLPVVVATRMSLSFPVLLGAVPLYAVDFGLKENQDESKAPRAERCWFSDGGISSNLPIHFFDAPLPSWPTFAINLTQFHPDYQLEKDAIFLPENVRGGMQIAWTRFEPAGRFGSLAGFLWAIVNAMQNWQDATQARVPGYRDRMVHVSQRDDEGGLNLSMPADAVMRLADRGRRAGAALVARFGPSHDAAPAGWTEHRWVRFRRAWSSPRTGFGRSPKAIRARSRPTRTSSRCCCDRCPPPRLRIDLAPAINDERRPPWTRSCSSGPRGKPRARAFRRMRHGPHPRFASGRESDSAPSHMCDAGGQL